MSDITVVTQNPDFKKVLQEKVLNAFLGLIPEATLNEYVEKEIKAFFEYEQILTIDKKQIKIPNPNGNRSGYGYGNEPTITKDEFVISAPMAPFRQLVWSELYSYLQPIVKQQIEDETTKTRKALNEWVLNSMKDTVSLSYKINFESLAILNSKMILGNIYKRSVEMSNANLNMALNTIGYRNDGTGYTFTPMYPSENDLKDF